MSISEFELQTSCWSEADIALFIYAGIDILTFCYIDPAGLPAGVLMSLATISSIYFCLYKSRKLFFSRPVDVRFFIGFYPGLHIGNMSIGQVSATSTRNP
jgi:hypothetical protein